MTPGYTCRSSPRSFPLHKLRKGQWVSVIVRITSIGVERVDVATSEPCAASALSIRRDCQSSHLLKKWQSNSHATIQAVLGPE